MADFEQKVRLTLDTSDAERQAKASAERVAGFFQQVNAAAAKQGFSAADVRAGMKNLGFTNVPPSSAWAAAGGFAGPGGGGFGGGPGGGNVGGGVQPPPAPGGGRAGWTLAPPPVGRPEADILRMSGGRTLAPPPVGRRQDFGPGPVMERRATAEELIEVFGPGKSMAAIQKMVRNAQGIADESGKAKSAWSQHALSLAYATRHMFGGGAAGAIGGTLGMAAGAFFGPQGALFGSIAGHTFGQQAGNLTGQNDAGMALARPGLARLRELAERDAEAAASRNYTATYVAQTQLERLKADFAASGGKTVTGAIGDLFDKAGAAIKRKWIEVLAQVQGVDIKPGAGAGAAVSQMAGHIFSGPDDAWNAFASKFMLASGGERAAAEAAAQAAREATRPGAGTVLSDANAALGRLRGLAEPEFQPEAFSPASRAFAAMVAGGNDPATGLPNSPLLRTGSLAPGATPEKMHAASRDLAEYIQRNKPKTADQMAGTVTGALAAGFGLFDAVFTKTLK